jgi:hypothetical protein
MMMGSKGYSYTHGFDRMAELLQVTLIYYDVLVTSAGCVFNGRREEKLHSLCLMQ